MHAEESVFSVHYEMMRSGWLEPSTHGAASVPPGLDVQLDSATRLITARGEFDQPNAEVMADVVATLIDVNPGDSTIDIAEVSFIDSGGLRCLVELGNQFMAVGATLTITGATPRVRRVFEIVGLAQLLAAG